MDWVIWTVGVVAMMVSGVVQGQCLVEQVVVTLGDNFSLEGGVVDHMYTLSFTASLQCSQPSHTPTVGITTTDGTVLMLGQYWTKPISVQIAGVWYNQTGWFYPVSPDQVRSGTNWGIYSNGSLIEGPINFPVKTGNNDGNIQFAVVADMDLTAYATDTISQITNMNSGQYDMFFHVGDFAYNIEDNAGQRGDDFFNRMSQTMRSVPYIITPGNHENFLLGTLFNYRFRMPTTPNNWITEQQNHYYDFVYKSVYFVTINFDYVLVLHPGKINMLVQWLEGRLIKASQRPDIEWRVFYSHRPIFCNDMTYSADCSVNMYYLKAIEDLWIKYKVDAVINGHLHIYSRLKPFYNFQVLPYSSLGNGSYLQVISGHAGTSHYFPDNSTYPLYNYSFVQTVDVSGPTYMIYTINKYNLRGKLLASSNNTVLDEFMIGVEDPTSNRSTLGVILSLVLLLSVGLFLVLFYLCRVYSSGDSDHQESNLTSAGYIVEGGSRKVSSWVI